MFTECFLQHYKSVKWLKFPKPNFPSLSPEPFNAFLKTLPSLNACLLVFLFFPNSVLFQTLQNFTWPHSSCDFVAYELIKYNGFQFSRNWSDETPCLMVETVFLRVNFEVQTYYKPYKNNQLQTWSCEFYYLWKKWVWKRLNIFLKRLYFGLFKKTICNLISPKCLVVLGMVHVERVYNGWGWWASKFYTWTNLPSIWLYDTWFL